MAAWIRSFEIGEDIFYPALELIEDGPHVLNPFDHPFPLELDAICVVDDVPEATVRLHLCGKRFGEQHGKRRAILGRRTEPPEELDVPLLRFGKLHLVVADHPLKHVLNAHVEGRQKLPGRGFLAERSRPLAYVRVERLQLLNDAFHLVEFEADFFAKLTRVQRAPPPAFRYAG